MPYKTLREAPLSFNDYLQRRTQEATVGYKIKIQRVERGITKSFYVNFPAAIAEAAKIQKGEEMEWIIEDRDTFILKRIKATKSAIKRKKKTLS